MRAALVVVAALTVVAAAAAAPASHGAEACAPVPAYRLPTDRPRYTLDVTVPIRGAVTGRETVRFRALKPTSRIVLRLWANAPVTVRAGAVETATVVSTTPSARRVPSSKTVLDLRLKRPLRRGEQATVVLRWTLRNAAAGVGVSRLAAGPDWIRLGSFFPLLALDDQGNWAVDPPSSLAAETWVSPSADWDVRLRLPPDWTLLSTGTRVAPGRYAARAVRDFALAAGRFERREVTVRAPAKVVVTATAVDGPTADAFLHRAAQSLVHLSELYGPYPWPRYSVAVFDDLGRSGIEYPNIVFQGPGSLERATAHEAAHQWFYSLVGNNQARDPWLDESLASWAMTRVDAATTGIASVPIPDVVRGKLTAPMTYWDQVPNEYFVGVYAQGYEAFASLGDGARTDCALKLYVAHNAYGVATPSELVAALAERLPADALQRFAAFA
jgi:hypothetical protein